MRKTTNWSLNELVMVGASDLMKNGRAGDLQEAMKKATSAILFVVRDELISQLPKSVIFDNDKFSIAIFEENDTVLVQYDGHVFEVNQRPNMGPTERGFLGFNLVDSKDERYQPYVDKLARIKDKARRMLKEYRENKATYDQHAGTSDKTFLN
jgi:hypothetical protein